MRAGFEIGEDAHDWVTVAYSGDPMRAEALYFFVTKSRTQGSKRWMSETVVDVGDLRDGQILTGSDYYLEPGDANSHMCDPGYEGLPWVRDHRREVLAAGLGVLAAGGLVGAVGSVVTWTRRRR